MRRPYAFARTQQLLLVDDGATVTVGVIELRGLHGLCGFKPYKPYNSILSI
jgi:hypothetical protein